MSGFMFAPEGLLWLRTPYFKTDLIQEVPGNQVMPATARKLKSCSEWFVCSYPCAPESGVCPQVVPECLVFISICASTVLPPSRSLPPLPSPSLPSRKSPSPIWFPPWPPPHLHPYYGFHHCGAMSSHSGACPIMGGSASQLSILPLVLLQKQKQQILA